MNPAKRTAAGAVIVSLVVLVAIFAPLLTPHDPGLPSSEGFLTPPFWQEGGTVSHLLGTDNLGRDVLSRLIYGTRTSLLVALGALAVGGVIGIPLGLVFAYYKTPWEAIYDVDVSFLPVTLLTQGAWLFLLIFIGIIVTLLIEAYVGSSTTLLILVLGLLICPRYIKVIRRKAITLMADASVARAGESGISDYATAMRRFLPKMTDILPSLFFSQMAFLLFWDLGLNYLGIGVAAPVPSLGSSLGDLVFNQSPEWSQWAIALAIPLLTVAGFWMLGDGLGRHADSGSGQAGGSST